MLQGRERETEHRSHIWHMKEEVGDAWRSISMTNNRVHVSCVRNPFHDEADRTDITLNKLGMVYICLWWTAGAFSDVVQGQQARSSLMHRNIKAHGGT